MDVSVILPTRNRSALMSAALRSVLWQQDVDLEVIVIDEASTDDTPAVLAALADTRVRIVRHEVATGVANARNHGATLARGEWIAFLDDDDLWAPSKLVRQLEAANQSGSGWAYSGGVVINGEDRITRVQRPLPPHAIVTALLRYDAIPGGASNVVVRQTTWQHTGRFDTRLRNTADWELYIRLAQNGLPACVCSPLVARRLHSSNMTLDVAEIVREIGLIEVLHHTKADWGTLHRWMAHSCLRAGSCRAALGQFTRAAVRGQAFAVAADLRAILRRELVRPPRTTDEHASSQDAWIVAATTWLREIRNSAVESPRPTAADRHVAQAPVSSRQ
jgi:hypothetical protein